jgi:hypothetical protein
VKPLLLHECYTSNPIFGRYVSFSPQVGTCMKNLCISVFYLQPILFRPLSPLHVLLFYYLLYFGPISVPHLKKRFLIFKFVKKNNNLGLFFLYNSAPLKLNLLLRPSSNCFFFVLQACLQPSHCSFG